MERKILDVGQLTDALKTLDGWSVDGKLLKKSVKFDNFAQALDHVNRVGALAEAADHHPDITFGWGYADITLTTHDRGGITDVDVALAGKIDKL
ncbi:MAG TPA: 4a-hydroxytetrahydrobiopterin dehydratase [Pyrinomonadaceae bacterium]|nr:4a-hydroxytetrahydrobiopterin dehydratase [Acidobacteriota bacterium]HQZ95939.1 4a-hydroxytetrahydrobiopterin dehydratase [Pyrinomonadaceae bacterium]